jgi:hypothetical protein
MATAFDINNVENEEQKFKQDIPNGFIPIELSTQGLVGAPKRFHTRNFDTSDLLNLALSEDEELPEKVAKMLDTLILEENVTVMDFHEAEVIEFLVRLYKAFYSNNLKEVDFPWTDEDIDLLKKQYGGESSPEFQNLYADLRSGKWKPKTDIDLNLVETYDIEKESFHDTIYITDKKTDFTIGFSYPRYGDVIVLRNFMLNEFRDKDKQFAQIKDVLKFRRDAEDRLRKGEDINLNRIPNIPEAEKERFKQYEIEKSLMGVKAVKALHLVYFENQDIAELPILERMKLAEDPRLDYKVMKKVSDYFDNLNIGLKKEIRMLNPITQDFEIRGFSFRLVDILQAIKLYESDELDINFEHPHV